MQSFPLSGEPEAEAWICVTSLNVTLVSGCQGARVPGLVTIFPSVPENSSLPFIGSSRQSQASHTSLSGEGPWEAHVDSNQR